FKHRSGLWSCLASGAPSWHKHHANQLIIPSDCDVSPKHLFLIVLIFCINACVPDRLLPTPVSYCNSLVQDDIRSTPVRIHHAHHAKAVPEICSLTGKDPSLASLPLVWQ